ncbi:MAG TPA: ABC transporter substrate-binding protein, partial [Ruminiclostridium sp.]|nr:ABC transporter substrate-binding protein [Ruminiclostridium sp.]
NMGYAMGNQFLSPLWRGEQPDLWEQMKKDNDTALRSKALGFTFNSENVKTELAAVNSVRSQYRMLIECGLADPDSGIIEEYVAKMKEAGVDKIIAEKQAQLDAWLAKK